MIISLDFEQNNPKFDTFASLSGVNYNIRIFYSYFDQSYYLTFKDIVNNIKIVNGIDLLKNYRFLNVPPGELRCVRRVGRKSKPNFNDIGPGKEMELVYIENV
jgi:hypothetical protein